MATPAARSAQLASRWAQPSRWKWAGIRGSGHRLSRWGRAPRRSAKSRTCSQTVEIGSRMSGTNFELSLFGRDEIHGSHHVAESRRADLPPHLPALPHANGPIPCRGSDGVARSGSHQVARLNVAMDHTALVYVLQSQAGLTDVFARLVHRQRAGSLDKARRSMPSTYAMAKTCVSPICSAS